MLEAAGPRWKRQKQALIARASTTTPPGRFVAPNKPANDCDQLKKDLAYQLKVYAQNGGSVSSPAIANTDLQALGALVGGTGVSAYGVYTDSRLALNGRALPLEMNQYTNMTPGYAKGVTRVGYGAAAVGIAFDGVAFYNAAQEGDTVGAGFSGANIVADVGALALGGPAGLAIGIGQVGINIGLTAYTSSWNAQLKEQAKGVMQQMERTQGVAKEKISDTVNQMQKQGCK